MECQILGNCLCLLGACQILANTVSMLVFSVGVESGEAKEMERASLKL